MPSLHNDVYDNGLSVLDISGIRLDICHTEPTTYAQATTAPGGGFSVGNKTGLSIAAPSARTPNGRKVTVAAFSDGTITFTSTGATDDAAHWAITDGTSRLLAAGPLASTQMVTSGNTFSLAAFDIGIPAPT